MTANERRNLMIALASLPPPAAAPAPAPMTPQDNMPAPPPQPAAAPPPVMAPLIPTAVDTPVEETAKKIVRNVAGTTRGPSASSLANAGRSGTAFTGGGGVAPSLTLGLAQMLLGSSSDSQRRRYA